MTMPSSSPAQLPVSSHVVIHTTAARHTFLKSVEASRKQKTPRRCLCSQSEQIFNDMIKCIVFDPLVYSTSPFQL